MNIVANKLRDRGFEIKRHGIVRYVDDALVGSSTPEEHLQVLCIILIVLGHHGWTLNARKGN